MTEEQDQFIQNLAGQVFDGQLTVGAAEFRIIDKFDIEEEMNDGLERLHAYYNGLCKVREDSWTRV